MLSGNKMCSFFAMAKFTDFLNKISGAIDSASRSLFNFLPNQARSLINGWTGAALTGAQQEANEFSANQAQVERNWQEDMRATNYQTQVADMRSAGINPAVMYGNGASSSTPSGASAASVAPSAPMSMSDMIQVIMAKAQLSKLKAETANIDSQTEVNRVETSRIEAETSKLTSEKEYIDLQKSYYPKLTDAQIGKINAEVNKLVAEIPYLKAMSSEANASAGLKKAQALLVDKEYQYADRRFTAEIDKIIAEGDVAALQKKINEFRIDYMHKYGTDVPASGWATFLSLLGRVGDETFGSVLRMFAEALKGVFKGAVQVDTKVENKFETPLSVPSKND